MRRTTRIEGELIDLKTQLERMRQQIQRPTEELSQIRLQETQHERTDEQLSESDIVRLLNHPYVTGELKKVTRFYVWVKDNNGDTT